MISKNGCLLAERFALLRKSGGMKYLETVNYVKVRQLLTERDKWRSNWIDRSRSIRTQILQENPRLMNLSALKLYNRIEGFERIFAINHDREIRSWCEMGGLDPRIHKSLGGFGLPDSGVTYDFNNRMTRRHSRIVAWCSRNNLELGYTYIKGLKKASSTSENLNITPWKRNYIADFQKDGCIPVKRRWVKDLIIRSAGWLWAIDAKSFSRKKSLEEIYWAQKCQIEFYYSWIKYDLLKIPARTAPFESLRRGPSNRNSEASKDLRNPQWFNIECLKEDPRIIEISVEAALTLRKLEDKLQTTLENISTSRQTGEDLISTYTEKESGWYPILSSELQFYELKVDRL